MASAAMQNDFQALNRSINRFLAALAEDGRMSITDLAVRAVPEIEQAHMIAGNFDYLLKVRTRDMTQYRAFLGDVVSALPHVTATLTFVLMTAAKKVMLPGVN